MEWDEHIDELMIKHFSEAFDTACRALGYQVLVSGADRHGSFVWEAGRADSLNRFITVGVTPATKELLEREPGGRLQLWNAHIRQNYAMELAIAADDGERFYRSIENEWLRSWRDDLSDWDGEHFLPTKLIVTLIAMAIEKLSEVTEEQLNERYIVPRPPSMPQQTRVN